MAESIPETPEALTPQWLSEALGVAVQSVRLDILGEGQGFMGDILRLHLQSHDPQCPTTVIAKLPKLSNRAMGEMLGVYEREVMFFQDLGSQVPSRIPTIYFSYQDRDRGSEQQKTILAKLDSAPKILFPLVTALGRRVAANKKRRYLLLMEDLASFEPGDQFVGAPVSTCIAVLEQIAATHRAHWESEALDEHFWLLPLAIDARMRQQIFVKAIPAFRRTIQHNVHPHLDWLGMHGTQLMRDFAQQAPATLLHGDLRLDNVCFNGTDCAFLDWQLTRVGPAAYDVAYFLGSAMAADVSHAEETLVLQRYHEALNLPDYPFARFYLDYQRALVLTLSTLASVSDIDIDAGRGQQMMDRWRARLTARVQHVDVDKLLH